MKNHIPKKVVIALLDVGGWFQTDHGMGHYSVWDKDDHHVGHMRVSTLDAVRRHYLMQRPLGDRSAPFAHSRGGVACRRYRLARFGPPPAVEWTPRVRAEAVPS